MQNNCLLTHRNFFCIQLTEYSTLKRVSNLSLRFIIPYKLTLLQCRVIKSWLLSTMHYKKKSLFNKLLSSLTYLDFLKIRYNISYYKIIQINDHGLWDI
jgi:hypothetical protein